MPDARIDFYNETTHALYIYWYRSFYGATIFSLGQNVETLFIYECLKLQATSFKLLHKTHNHTNDANVHIHKYLGNIIISISFYHFEKQLFVCKWNSKPMKEIRMRTRCRAYVCRICNRWTPHFDVIFFLCCCCCCCLVYCEVLHTS